MSRKADELLRTVSPSSAAIFLQIRRQGKANAHTLSGSRTEGLTKDLNELEKVGLIEKLGRRSLGGLKPAMVYQVVPEFAAVRRQAEKGDYDQWYATRRRVIELSNSLRRIDAMAFWQAAPEDDRQRVLAEMMALSAWTDQVIKDYAQRQADDRQREKIRRMRDTNGRTPAEAETAHQLADRLEAELADVREA